MEDGLTLRRLLTLLHSMMREQEMESAAFASTLEVKCGPRGGERRSYAMGVKVACIVQWLVPCLTGEQTCSMLSSDSLDMLSHQRR